MAKLLYQGHASFRIVSDNGVVIYVDPFAGTGYDLSADLILVTHEHSDHNRITIVQQNTECHIVRSVDLHSFNSFSTITDHGISIEAVPAFNKNHNKNDCVGYVMTFESGILLYAAGDTSYTDFMENNLAKRSLNYALLPCDGVFNMNVKEAVRCADCIGAQYAVPIHMKPGSLFDENIAAQFTAKNRLIIRPGEEITLK